MPTVDTAAAVEQLLKRFEHLRSGGLIELLTVEAAAGSKLPPELPPHQQRFSASRRSHNVLYGQPAGSGPRVIDFRFLGSRSDVSRFCNVASAAAQRMAVPLAEAGFIHPADCKASHKDACLITWLVAMLAAAAEGRLSSDGMQGGGWRVWSRGTDISRVIAAADGGSSVQLLEPEAEPATRYAVLENVAETSIALLQCLAAAGKQERRERRDDKPKKPFHNLVACLEEILNTNGGKERLLGCVTAEQACEHIQSLYPGQPATPSGLGDAWKKLGKRFPAYPWKKAQRNRRTVVEASRLGEHVDLDRFEGRGSALPKLAPQRLKCAECDEDIPPGEHMQSEGKVYCFECGNEKLHGIMPSQ